MSWKFVFHCSLSLKGRDKCFEMAKQAGYEFMSFNGIVWHVNSQTETMIKHDDLY